MINIISVSHFILIQQETSEKPTKQAITKKSKSSGGKRK